METKLIKAVKQQLNSEGEELKGTLEDIANHGADAGWSGFTYFNDTCEFYRKNQKAIVEAVEELAQDIGESAVNMVQGFNCLGKDYEIKDIALTLYGTPKQHDQYIANALSWFALEEVARFETDR